MQENHKTNIPAIISLILSILSIICCCIWYISLVMGIVAVVLGVLTNNPNQKDAAIAGIVVGAVGFALAVSVAVMYIMILSGVSGTATTAALGIGSMI